jgi:hypothetical protein
LLQDRKTMDKEVGNKSVFAIFKQLVGKLGGSGK